MEYIEKTDYLKESKEILKDALIDLGANIDSNTPFRQYINSIDDIYNDFPKVTEEGSNITLENTRKGKMQIQPMGNTTQNEGVSPDNPQPIKNVTGNNVVKIGGKNLWDEEWELGNINNDTGGLENSDTFIRTKNYIEILPNTSYYRTSTVEATRIFYYDSLYNYMSNTIVSAAGETFTTPNNAKYIKFKQYGTAYNNDICITKGTTSTEYEPYIEPIEKKLNLKSENLAQIRNNLQPFGGSVTATKIIYNDTGTRKSSLLKIEPNTQYTIYRQKSISGGTLQSKTRYFFYDTKPIIDSTLSIGGNYLPDGLSNFITVITTPATAQYLIIQWTMDNIDAGNCAIYKGSYTLETLPKYEPYYNYTLMKDDYITEDCVIHHKRKKMILDGSEDWIDYVSQTTGLYKAYSESKKINSLFTAENSKCSHFKTSSVIATMTSEFFSATKYAIYIGISTEIASNATELKKYILQQYNNGTPVIIEYELIAEETEIIPDTIQLYNQIKELYKTIIPNQTILVETESEEENAPLIVKASALKQ